MHAGRRDGRLIRLAGISKLALNRLVEFISLGEALSLVSVPPLMPFMTLEYSDSVKSFAVHPGAVWTDMPKVLAIAFDTRGCTEL